jgi:hypothetical protein
MKEKVIARLIKCGFGKETATEIVEGYMNMAIRCYRLRETQIALIAETASGLWAAD